MSEVSYWKNQITQLQKNQPKSASSYYNQSFVDRMNEAQKNIDGLVARKDKAWSATAQAQNDYKTFSGTMSTYEDEYRNAESQFGVKNAMADYEKNKEALALAETTLEALPSNINAQSNRVLTQTQRENRYNILSNQFNKVQTNLQKQGQVFEDVWKNARESQQAYAQSVIAQQNTQLEDYDNAWITAMNNYDNIVKQWENARLEKEQIGKDYRQWQTNQYNAEKAIYDAKMSNANKRYQAALQSAQQSTPITSTQYYDFGNGFTLVNVNGEARYLKNGKQVSAYEFLYNTSGKNTNWDLWNTVWKSGISTTGVGSDTIDAFSKKGSTAGFQNLVKTKYAYLTKI